MVLFLAKMAVFFFQDAVVLHILYMAALRYGGAFISMVGGPSDSGGPDLHSREGVQCNNNTRESFGKLFPPTLNNCKTRPLTNTSHEGNIFFFLFFLEGC